MALRNTLSLRPLIAILAATMMVVALACAGNDAAPTSPPTATQPAPTATLVPGAPTAVAEATATPVPVVDLESLPWIERLVHLPGYKPEWGTPQRGGIFKVGLGVSPTAFTPGLGGAFQAPMFVIHNQMVRFDPWVGTNSIIPDLARSWEISGDGLQITFKLEERVKFQDNPNIPERLRNADFTCEDVVASMERYLWPETWDTQGGQKSLGHVNSITCPDGPLGYTAVLNLDSPKSKTLGELAVGNPVMLDKGWWEWVKTEVGAAQKSPSNESYKRLTGTGPFVPVEYQPDIIGKIRRNPTYFREGLPLVDGIDNFILKDATSRFTAVATGQIHLMGHGSTAMLPGQVAQAQRDFPDRIVIHAALYGLGYGVIFVTNRPPFDDVRVRRAMHLAIDRDAYLLFKRSGTYEGAVLATPGLIPGYWANTEEELRTWPGYRHPKDQDIAEANRLLDEVFGKGNRFKTSCLSRNQQQTMDVCLFFGDQMKRHLNIDVTMEAVEQAILSSDRGARCLFEIAGGTVGSAGSGDPDASLLSFHRRYVVATSYTACGMSFLAPSEFQAELEALMDAQSIEQDPVKRRELVRAVDRKVTQEAIYQASFGWLMTFYATRLNVKGYYLMANPQSTFHHIYERTWLAK